MRRIDAPRRRPPGSPPGTRGALRPLRPGSTRSAHCSAATATPGWPRRRPSSSNVADAARRAPPPTRRQRRRPRRRPARHPHAVGRRAAHPPRRAATPDRPARAAGRRAARSCSTSSASSAPCCARRRASPARAARLGCSPPPDTDFVAVDPVDGRPDHRRDRERRRARRAARRRRRARPGPPRVRAAEARVDDGTTESHAGRHGPRRPAGGSAQRRGPPRPADRPSATCRPSAGDEAPRRRSRPRATTASPSLRRRPRRPRRSARPRAHRRLRGDAARRRATRGAPRTIRTTRAAARQPLRRRSAAAAPDLHAGRARARARRRARQGRPAAGDRRRRAARPGGRAVDADPRAAGAARRDLRPQRRRARPVGAGVDDRRQPAAGARRRRDRRVLARPPRPDGRAAGRACSTRSQTLRLRLPLRRPPGRPADRPSRSASLDLVGVARLRRGPPDDAGRRHRPSVIGQTDIDGIGIAGLELQYNDLLPGQSPGEMTLEVAPGGRSIAGTEHVVAAGDAGDRPRHDDRPLGAVPGRAGARPAGRRHRGAGGGQIIVMDTDTGDIIAMVSVDRNDQGVPVVSGGNFAAVGAYEPGSVGKVITVAGALEEGAVTPDTMFGTSRGSTTAPIDEGGVLHDSHPHDPWSLTTDGILVESSNVGTILVSKTIGYDAARPLHARVRPRRAHGPRLPGRVGRASSSRGTTGGHGALHGGLRPGRGVDADPADQRRQRDRQRRRLRRAPARARRRSDADGEITDAEPSETHQVVSEQTATRDAVDDARRRLRRAPPTRRRSPAGRSPARREPPTRRRPTARTSTPTASPTTTTPASSASSRPRTPRSRC